MVNRSLARRMWFPRPYRSFVEARSPSRSFPLDPNNLSGFQSRITSTSPISPSYPYYQIIYLCFECLSIAVCVSVYVCEHMVFVMEAKTTNIATSELLT
ncbi:hypothetical protein Anas_04620 [Armadillidium nasatum]|uniref:Uncharacterized protein n=1 Tax=Armadillidium nasatum TaxID=96803 RepID=A0A5N5SYG8_9CRUS|nr:hypothetical protein Anas_04620 [Armadillidium nasatum]